MHELWGSATGTTAEGINSSPAVVGGLAYVGSDDGSLWALDAPTGAPVWHDRSAPWGMWAGAAFAQGTVYVGSGQSKVFAYDAATGGLVWSRSLGSRVRSTPSVADGKVFVGTDAGTVVALSAVTGAIRWSSSASPPSTGAVVRSSPAVSGGRVFVATAETTPMDGDAVAFDEKTGAVDWRADYVADYSTSSPAIANGVLYLGSYDTRVYAIKASSGKLLWAPAWGSDNMERGFNSSPAIANGRIYIGCRDGSLYSFGPG